MNDRLDLACIAADHRSVPSDVRSSLALRFHETIPSGSGVLLSTCHRVEAFVAPASIVDGMRSDLPTGVTVLLAEEAVRRAIALGVGLTSVILAEDQLLHQVREAVAVARRDRSLADSLDRLFSLGLRAGRIARSWRPGPSVSLADVALDAAARGGAREGAVLVVGAGEMGARAAAAAARRGRSTLIASRTPEHAERLAGTLGGTAVPFDPGPGMLGGVVTVLVALRGQWHIGDLSGDALVAGRCVVIDFSSPPALAADLRSRLGARFISVDDLALHAPSADARYRERLRKLVDDMVAEYLAWAARQPGDDLIEALVAQAEQQRETELGAFWNEVPDLDPLLREEIDRMSRHLARRLLREPIERLAHDTDGRRRAAARELFGL